MLRHQKRACAFLLVLSYALAAWPVMRVPSAPVAHAAPLDLVPRYDLLPAKRTNPYQLAPSSPYAQVSAAVSLLDAIGNAPQPAPSARAAIETAVPLPPATPPPEKPVALKRTKAPPAVSAPDVAVTAVSTAPGSKIGPYVAGEEYTFKTTGYCHCAKCNGKWAYGPLANGGMPKAGRTVAMGEVPLGTRVLVNGHEYVVEDRGVTGKHIDVYYDTHEQAWNHGKKTVTVIVLGR